MKGISLTGVIAWLQEYKTGRICTVSIKPALMLGFGFIRDKTESGTTETYFAPFVRVIIFQSTAQ